MKIGFCLIVALLFLSCGSDNRGVTEHAATNKNIDELIVEYAGKLLVVTECTFPDKDLTAIVDHMESRGRRGEAPVYLLSNTIIPVGVEESGRLLDPQVAHELNGHYSNFYSYGNIFYENYHEFVTYCSQKGYETDNWARGKRLASENKDIYTRICTHRGHIKEMLDPMKKNAELAIIEKSPLKEQILYARNIMHNMDSILYEFRATYKNRYAIQRNFEEIDMLLKNSLYYRSLPGHEEKMGYYNEFLQQADNFLNDIKRIYRNNRYSELEYRNLIRTYKQINRTYTFFAT